MRPVEVIAPNFSRRVSGVTATVRRLLPLQAEQIGIAGVGDQLHELPAVLSRWAVLRLLFTAAPRGRRVWHARRNTEMLLGVLLKYLLRRKLVLLFTSAAQRRHSAYTRWLIRRMDHLVAPCAASASYLDHEATVIHHGIDLSEFAYRPRVAGDTVTVAQVGRVRPQKGSDILVDAVIPLLRDNPSLRLKMVGLVTPSFVAYADDLKARLHNAGVAAQVEWVQDLAWSELVALYASVDILVACPRNEGFGLTPLEAMASGAAVVLSREGAFPEMVDDAHDGYLVPTGDVTALREALAQLTSDAALRTTMAERANIKVRQRFSVEHEAAALVALYEALLEGHPPAL